MRLIVFSGLLLTFYVAVVHGKAQSGAKKRISHGSGLRDTPSGKLTMAA